MDRTNTWFRRAVLSVILLWPLQAGAGSPEVEQLAKEAARHADHNKILIVGVSHDNERLADELLELLMLLRADDEFNCFFVEYSTDLQEDFDEAVNEVDIGRFIEAWLLSMKPAALRAFREFGYNSNADQASIASYLDERTRVEVRRVKKGIGNTHPVNRDLLMYLRENEISLLPYDADSRSAVMFESATFEMRMKNPDIPDPDYYDMVVALFKNFDARNAIMAENIAIKFASHECNKAIVTVGANHVAMKGTIQWKYRIQLDSYTPLQTRLPKKGLPTERVGRLLGQRKR